MARRVFSLFLIVSALAASPVFSFEINGFKSGMTRKQVKALAEKKYSKIQDEQEMLTAWNIDANRIVDSILLSFCRDKLVFVSSVLDADFSIKNIFLLTDRYLQTYGQPSRVVATSDVLARGVGESRSIVYVWRSGHEQYSLIFTYLENAAGSINLLRQTDNTCFNPRY